MSIKRIWREKEVKITDEMLKCCSGNRVLAVLLLSRGINTPDKINNFLNPLKYKPISPDVFTQMEKTIKRIQNAVANKEHITVYGDFDADGITSTAIMYLALKHLGADADYYIPDRMTESHGLNTKAIISLISKKHTKLIITVDCGISNVNEVNFAKSFKTDIIITDHHEAPAILPEPYSVINPKAKGNIDENLDMESINSLNYLSGAGIAFKLVCKLLEVYSKEEYINEILPIAAIGTIGDVVELKGENRSIAAMGIELLRCGRVKGIQKILDSAGISDKSSITSETIAFTIVPRLNAAGRLEKPQTAIDIFINEDDNLLDSDVKTLNDLNELRQNLCEKTFLEAKSMYEKDICGNKKSIILLNNGWHIGIIGIVCSRLAEEFNKPVFLMTKSSSDEHIIRCSCRSINGINIHEILSEHKDLYESFGGHKMAAGFSFDENKISFENFKSKLNKTIDYMTRDFEFDKQITDIDMRLEPDDINTETADLIEKMQPFGTANPSPVFIMNDVILNNYKIMGQNNNHLKMFVSKNNSQNLECIKWNFSDFSLPLNSKMDIMFSLRKNYFNDNTTVQLIIEDIHSGLLKEKNNQNKIMILDHRLKKNILMQVLDFLMNTKKTTAIYLKCPGIKKEIILPESYKGVFFTEDNIPGQIEQLMFFEAPESKEIFFKILRETRPRIVHLMNFNSELMNSDKYLIKLSGMLKYALTNLKGETDIQRASKALNSSAETVEYALELFEASDMIDLERISDEIVKITYIHPLELSKIKQNELFAGFENRIDALNKFRQFYSNAQISEIKSFIG